MFSITTNTICKNSADFIEPVLKQVLPYVEKAIVSVDRASTDGKIGILERMAKEYHKIDLDYYEVKNPLKDLVEQKNRQIQKSKSEWIWTLDDDDFYPIEQVKNIIKFLEGAKADAYLIKCWFPVDKEHYYPPKGNWNERFFRNVPGLEWENNFLHETINKPKMRIETKIAYFIHLSYLKTRSWRREWNKKLYPRYKHVKGLPDYIKDILKKI